MSLSVIILFDNVRPPSFIILKTSGTGQVVSQYLHSKGIFIWVAPSSWGHDSPKPHYIAVHHHQVEQVRGLPSTASRSTSLY